MKQITLNQEAPCLGRLVMPGLLFGIAMMLVWELAGPTPAGHAFAWAVGIVAGFKLRRAMSGA